MKLKTLRQALTVGAMAVASVYSISASAVPSFTFTERGGFTYNALLDGNPIDYGINVDGVAVAAHPTTDPYPSTPTYQWISWGTAFTGIDSVSGLPYNPLGRKSGLQFDGLGEGALPTSLIPDPEGEGVAIGTIFHHNNVITSAPSFSGQLVLGRFIIYDADGGTAVVLDSTDPITIDFTETSNGDAVTGFCVPDPNATTSPLACDDYFSFTASGLDSIPFFANDGSAWWVDFEVGGLYAENSSGVPFTDELGNTPVFPAFDAPNTIITAEAIINQLSIFASVRPREVPEPSTLALVGLGLLGCGLSARRKQSNAKA